MRVLQGKTQDTNINETERWVSLIGGGSLIAYGLTKRKLTGFGLAALGTGLLWRGATGHCDLYRAIGVNTLGGRLRKGTGRCTSVPYELGIRVDESIRIHKRPDEVYRFWRRLDNLPKFMNHLESVETIDPRKSHWTAKGPVGLSVDWYAEIINDVENELIGWRSLEGSEIANAGSVSFHPALNGQATDVKVSLQYNPPAGDLGAAVAKLFGTNPKKQIRTDIKAFKELMERGRVSGKASQKGSTAERGFERKLWDRDKVTEASEESFPASDPPSWTPESV